MQSLKQFERAPGSWMQQSKTTTTTPQVTAGADLNTMPSQPTMTMTMDELKTANNNDSDGAEELSDEKNNLKEIRLINH